MYDNNNMLRLKTFEIKFQTKAMFSYNDKTGWKVSNQFQCIICWGKKQQTTNVKVKRGKLSVENNWNKFDSDIYCKIQWIINQIAVVFLLQRSIHCCTILCVVVNMRNCVENNWSIFFWFKRLLMSLTNRSRHFKQLKTDLLLFFLPFSIVKNSYIN